MAEQLIYWDPTTLRQIGIAVLLVSITVVIAKPLENMGMQGRARTVLAGSIGLLGYWSMHQTPALQTTTALLSAALAVVVPLAICLHAMKVMVAGN